MIAIGNKCKILAILCIALLSLACKNGVKNPELLDPVYIDLQKEEKNYKNLLKEEEARLAVALKEKKTLEVGSVEVVRNGKEIAKAKKNILNYKQKAKYYEIRVKRRKVEARRSYKLSLEKGEDWPDPKEYKNYLTHKKLRSAPRNWGSRVPKLHKNNPNYKEE